MVARYVAMVDAFPIWSIEDGLGEADAEGWKKLTAALGGRIQLVGDDNFCMNPAIITEAIANGIANGIANAALIKVNQIGTFTETLEAMRICHEAGYGQMVSHRSSETPDTFIADLAMATGWARSRPAPRPAVSGSQSTTGSTRSRLPIPTWPTD